MSTPRTIAALCVSRNSVYKSLPGVDAFDIDRDARTFAGNMPIVTHPPCRSWSAFCGHQSKAPQEERDLAIWCCEQIKEWGGILEQPAHSRLFDAGGLPLPGDGRQGELWSLCVDQSWWGHPVRKKTWLCFSRIDEQAIELPFVLRNQRGDRNRWNTMSKNKRAATCPRLARWLVDLARTVSRPVELMSTRTGDNQK